MHWRWVLSRDEMRESIKLIEFSETVCPSLRYRRFREATNGSETTKIYIFQYKIIQNRVKISIFETSVTERWTDGLAKLYLKTHH